MNGALGWVWEGKVENGRFWLEEKKERRISSTSLMKYSSGICFHSFPSSFSVVSSLSPRFPFLSPEKRKSLEKGRLCVGKECVKDIFKSYVLLSWWFSKTIWTERPASLPDASWNGRTSWMTFCVPFFFLSGVSPWVDGCFLFVRPSSVVFHKKDSLCQVISLSLEILLFLEILPFILISAYSATLIPENNGVKEEEKFLSVRAVRVRIISQITAQMVLMWVGGGNWQ